MNMTELFRLRKHWRRSVAEDRWISHKPAYTILSRSLSLSPSPSLHTHTHAQHTHIYNIILYIYFIYIIYIIYILLPFDTKTQLFDIIWLLITSINPGKSSAASTSPHPGCRWVDWLPDMTDLSACGRPQLKNTKKKKALTGKASGIHDDTKVYIPPVDPNTVWEGTQPPKSYPKHFLRRYLDP